jgi:hypothetical protein
MTFSGFMRSNPARRGWRRLGDASWPSGVDGGAMTARDIVATWGRKQSH